MPADNLNGNQFVSGPLYRLRAAETPEMRWGMEIGTAGLRLGLTELAAI